MLKLTNIGNFPPLASVGGNMGTLDDRTSIARFSRPNLWVPIRLLGKFSGGSGSATLFMYLDHDPDSAMHSLELKSWATVGTSGTAIFIWQPTYDTLQGFVVPPPAEIVLVWANPSGGQTWEMMLTGADVQPGFGV